ncbi:MAG: DUF547 domain-containing protein [Pseudomonadota bacterium]
MSRSSLFIAACVVVLSMSPVSIVPSMAQEITAEANMASPQASLNAPYNDILSRYIKVEDGIHLFDYAAVSPGDKEKLEAYVTTLEGLTPSAMGQNEQIAYYANIYNAKTLLIILDNYPVSSIRDIGGNLIFKGPWRENVLTIEGQALSLDNIEHDIVRANFDEPRIHYAFNCASIGCPNLATKAWEAESLDADLDAAARAFVAHPRGIQIKENGKVQASSIYKWFDEDFGNDVTDTLNHIRGFTEGEKAEALKDVTRIHSYDYDWSLNDVK